MLYSIFSRILRRIYLFSGQPTSDQRVSVGEGTYGFGSKTVLLFREDDSVSIGRFCSIAYGVTIIASGEHNYQGVANYPFAAMFNNDVDRDTLSKGSVFIGNDVWLGANSIILSGVTIGDGAVIAAGAVVVGSVPPYAIVGGVPARIIKYRFSSEIIDSLLQVAWWNWPLPQIRGNLSIFYLPVHEFLRAAAEIGKANNVP